MSLVSPEFIAINKACHLLAAMLRKARTAWGATMPRNPRAMIYNRNVTYLWFCCEQVCHACLVFFQQRTRECTVGGQEQQGTHSSFHHDGHCSEVN